MDNYSGHFEQKRTSIVWTPRFIDRVCSLRGMNKVESRVKVGINYGKSFLKVSPKTMIDYYNDFKLHQSPPSGSVWLLEGLRAAGLGIIWKEHHRGSFKIRQCSRILFNVYFLELYVRNLEFEQESAHSIAIESSHLLFKQPGARLNADPILHCFPASTNSIKA